MSNRTLNPSSIEPALLAKTYTSFLADLDLVADSGTLLGGSRTGAAARKVRCTSGGVIAAYLLGSPTTKVLIELEAHGVEELQLVKIGASGDGTTATKITVFW